MPYVRKRRSENAVLEWLRNNPSHLIVSSFVLVILVGTLLLMLPLASAAGRWTGFLPALFTATSATCVTGLVVLETTLYFSFFGQLVICLLIQIGGLGLATITSFFYSFLVKRASWRQLAVAQESTATDSFSGALKLVRRIVVLTLSFEGVGALILIWRLYGTYGAGAVWKGIFQAVSAFCNAGFDLHGDGPGGAFSNLTAWNHDPVVLLVTSTLVICGGLGFLVWSNIIDFPRSRKFTFHAKTALALTGLFLLLSTLFFFFAERHNTGSTLAMGNLPAGQRPLAAFFQAVSTRTAGFNTIDQASLFSSSKLITVILMFIGAAPAGTGGGIKLTTFAIVVAMVISDVRGRNETVLRRHRISRNITNRATAVLALGLTLVVLATIILSFLEQRALAAGQFQLIDILMETTSAFGTVGLSSVGSASLHPASQLVLVFCMYAGRVGPAALALALAGRDKKQDVVYPEGRLLVG